MKTVFNMKNLMIMKNYSKYICTFILLMGMSVNAWGTDTYNKVTSLNDVTTDDYVIIGCKTASSFGILTYGNLDGGRIPYSESYTSYAGLPSSITDPAAASVWTLTVSTSGTTKYVTLYNAKNSHYIKSNAITHDGKYAYDGSTSLSFTIEYESGDYGTFKIHYGAYYLGVNKDYNWFRGYTGGNNSVLTALNGITLYKKVSCDKSVTINKGSETNCTFTLSKSGSQYTCDGVETTITITPSTGYGTPVVSESGASAAPAPGGSGNTQTLTYSTNTTGTSVINVSCSANEYAVLLEDGAGSGGTEAVEVTYNANTNLTTSVAVPTRLGYAFAGYWTSSDAGSTLITQLIDNNGAWIADVSGYTDASKNWKYADDISLYAKWTPNNYKLTVGTPSNVTIKATPDDKSDITEGNFDAAVPCDAIITLNAVVDAGYSQAGWKITKDADGSDVTTSYLYDETTMFMPPFDATITATMYGDFVFSCSELTLTPHLATTGTPIFITSAASKTVRSQDYIEITGDGLTPNTALSFGELGKFAIKNADGTAVTTDVNGEISANAYIFYTPDAGDTSDGLDKLTGITVSVGGAKPKTVVLTQDIIGRHLPADFVIAAKRNGKWYAIPSNMTMAESTTPVEIAVDDANNPTIAYTATTNNYSLYDQALSAGVKLAMHGQSDAPLAASPTTTGIGKSSATVVTNNQADNYLWLFTQTNTEVATAAEAKYTMKSLGGYNNYFVRLKENAGNPIWGQYDSGISELRLIPASDIVFTEAYFVEWGQHGGVIEVDAVGVDATSVVAHLGEATSSAITLSQTLTSGKSRASKYNYTVNFGVGIDFAAAASNGAMLTLEWKNEATTKAVSNIVVPKIVASNITINKANYPLKSDWNTEVHVLPGKTVTIDADYSPNPDVTIKELNIYPGATVVASTGTLIATTLVLRNGWSRAGEKAYDVARLYVTPSTATLKASNVYADWYIDYDQYYPVAVPWNATVANFKYRYCSVSPTVGHDKNIRLRYYDGASRATNVQEGVGSGANWKLYGDAGCASVPGTLTPSTGYAMTAKRPSGKAFSIIRMPLTLPSGTWGDGTWTTSGEAGTIGESPSDVHKDQVAVTAYGVKDKSETAYAEGWNFIANPYMSLHQGALSYNDESGDVIEYANVPDINFKEYDQLPIETTKLKPASAFLVQVPKTGTVTFDTGHRKASAPSYRTEEAPQASKQKAYILLSDEEANDMMGLIISDQYTAEYEMNADLEKLLGDGTSLRTYMRYGDMNMAYVAINEMLAKEWIPVSVRIPADGEYTFSLHEASKVSELEGVYLIDYQNGDKVTNLIEQSYTFSSTAGTINGRFSINAKAGERQTPTGIDAINAGGDINSDKPFKFIYHDKVYIWINGIIYDTTGKRVK